MPISLFITFTGHQNWHCTSSVNSLTISLKVIHIVILLTINLLMDGGTVLFAKKWQISTLLTWNQSTKSMFSFSIVIQIKGEISFYIITKTICIKAVELDLCSKHLTKALSSNNWQDEWTEYKIYTFTKYEYIHIQLNIWWLLLFPCDDFMNKMYEWHVIFIFMKLNIVQVPQN